MDKRKSHYMLFFQARNKIDKVKDPNNNPLRSHQCKPACFKTSQQDPLFLSKKLLWMLTSPLVALESIERFVCIPDEREAHLSFLLVWHSTGLSTVNGTSVFLRDLVNREVRHVNVGAESWFKRSSDATKLLPDHAAEEGMVFNLSCAAVLATLITNAMLRVT